jgi:hypothetical protein
MSETLRRVQGLIRAGEVEVSQHGVVELDADQIMLDDVVSGVNNAVVVEDYPSALRGPTVLILQTDRNGRPVHVLWGIPKAAPSPAVLITAYRPDPLRWSDDFKRRKR